MQITFGEKDRVLVVANSGQLLVLAFDSEDNMSHLVVEPVFGEDDELGTFDLLWKGGYGDCLNYLSQAVGTVEMMAERDVRIEPFLNTWHPTRLVKHLVADPELY